MLFITDFADLGLLFPMIAVVAVSLVLGGQRRDALAWTAAIALTLGAILLMKVMVAAWPSMARLIGHPSGHTAAGVVVYAGFAGLLPADRAARCRAAFAVGVICWLTIGASRVALGVHQLRDVVIGGVLGLAGALASAALSSAWSSASRSRSLVLAATVALCAMLLFHGERLHAERHIRAIVEELRASSKP